MFISILQNEIEIFLQHMPDLLFFGFRIFSNYFSQKTWKNKNNGLKEW